MESLDWDDPGDDLFDMDAEVDAAIETEASFFEDTAPEMDFDEDEYEVVQPGSQAPAQASQASQPASQAYQTMLGEGLGGGKRRKSFDQS